MALRLLKNGASVSIPPGKEEELRRFCEINHLSVTLEWLSGQWWLHSNVEKERPIGIEIDRELERHQNYFKKNSIQRELLARAIGIKGAYRPQVLDLSAGLLGDTLLFLAMGCEVEAIERHPLVTLLIESALGRAQHPLLENLRFRQVEARECLLEGAEVDVIYFDPMFEDSNEKALPRKEMRIFRSVISKDTDSVEVLKLALKQNARRVVVKRPRLSPTLFPSQPLQYLGKSTRYDVYLSQKLGNNESNLIK